MQQNADPKNYYGILGVSPDADEAAIKAAFRAKAMRYHPDRNPTAEAEVQFRRINEAYSIVGDPEKRRKYHVKAAKTAQDRTQPKPPSKGPAAEGKARTAEYTQPKAQPKPKPNPEASRATTIKPHFHACKSCGTLSAQPRVVVFREVIGRPFAALKNTISGVYCPRCATEKAVQASINTWVQGMLAVPKGPIWSLGALWNNLWGGEQPVEANARMLLSQARAFLGKGDIDLARATIAQAMPFAEKTAYRHEAETLLASLSTSSQKTLKSRWPAFGRSLWLQSIPFVAVFAIVGLAVTVSLSRDAVLTSAKPKVEEIAKEDSASPSLVMLPTGPNTPLPTYVTKRDMVPLRGAPSGTSKAMDFISVDQTITMIAIVPQQKWIQVKTADGKTGFMHLDDLK